ncbi:hypothetical protein KZ686_17175 [Cupriavidus cauae]|uniref:hypothetical protein n=1 Tax=Cupriavidus cauae TaxID=2608999 RepID=UPI002243FDAC|nr:hypothetical protein [Cupriavidus cauae]UZN51866.1 hypothetical protein KZ686_17175 [Cupriavidus cauae]
MFTVLKSWFLGVRAPLYLSATPATGRLTLAEQQNDEVSIAFIRADVNAPATAARGHGMAIVEIYRSRQSRAEYLAEWLAAQAEIGGHVRSSTAGNCPGDTGRQLPAGNGGCNTGGQLPAGNSPGDTGRQLPAGNGRCDTGGQLPAGISRSDTGGQPSAGCGERRVATASHDRREALRPHARRNAPARPLRPARFRGPQRSRDTSTDLDRPARIHPPGMEPCLPKHAVHISRCMTELGQDEPSGAAGMVSIGTLAGVEALGLSRSIQDLGRGW